MRQQKDKMKVGDKVGHEELYSLLVSRELSWQQIIYDLISSEQLDPWNIDLIKLTQRYVEKIKELEEASFFISSKVLLAAAILLRIKSELLIDRYIKSLDEILFGKEEKKEKPPIEINLDDVAELFPKTPLPRQRKVTLPELMSALNKAMTTEHRRIKKEIAVRHAITRFDHLIPKKSINIRFKIKEIYQKIKAFFSKNKIEKMAFTQLSSSSSSDICGCSISSVGFFISSAGFSSSKIGGFSISKGCGLASLSQSKHPLIRTIPIITKLPTPIKIF